MGWLLGFLKLTQWQKLQVFFKSWFEFGATASLYVYSLWKYSSSLGTYKNTVLILWHFLFTQLKKLTAKIIDGKYLGKILQILDYDLFFEKLIIYITEMAKRLQTKAIHRSSEAKET